MIVKVIYKQVYHLSLRCGLGERKIMIIIKKILITRSQVRHRKTIKVSKTNKMTNKARSQPFKMMIKKK